MLKIIKTDKKTNEVKIKLSPLIYPPEAISCAVEAFKVIGAVKNNGEVIITPSDKETDLKKIGYEFCDYVLGLLSNKVS